MFNISRAIVLVCLCAVAAGAQELDVPLTVHDTVGVVRVAEPCSTGVPLPQGLLQKPEGIAVFDKDGEAVPAQFKVLERWREFGSDESIKWLLVTFLADCPAKGRAMYHLRPGKNPMPGTAAKPVDGFGPFGISLTGADGKVFSAADVKAVDREVVESGPVRACVKLESPSKPPFGFIAWIYSYAPSTSSGQAGSIRIDLIVVLKNTPRKATGPLYFDDFSVSVKADGGEYFLGGEPGKTHTAGPGYLYQAGDGTSKYKKLGWNYTDGLILGWGKAKQTVLNNLPAFRGYQVMSGGKKSAEGNYALGWGAVGDGKKTTVLATRWFLQNYPSAVEVQKGQVISRPFPKYWDKYGGLHWLDDMQRKRFDMTLQVVDGEFTGATGDGIAMAWNRPLIAHCGHDWYRKTKAAGRPSKPRKAPDYKAGVFPHRFTRGNSWRSFGGDVSDSIKRRYHSTSMGRFLNSANPWDACRLLADATHSSGMNCFHVDDYQYPRDKDMLNYGQYCGTFRSAGKYRSGTRHHGYFPWNVAHFQAWEIFHAWRLFGDPLAKRTVDEFAEYLQGYVAWRQKNPGRLVAGTRADGHPFTNLVECYRVLGDKRLLKSMHDMAEVCWKQVNKQRGNYGVMRSWEGGKDKCEKPFMMAQVMAGIRAYHEITGSERAADQIYGMADFILNEASVGQWGYKYVVLIDPEKNKKHLADSLAKADKDGKHVTYGNLAWAMAWVHNQFGVKRFRENIDALNPKAYPYRKNHYTRYYPERPDKVPPAAVGDLKVEPLGDGKVKLSWTTPADAALLQIKHAARPMVKRLDLPGQKDTHANWWAASQVTGEPEPKAGAQSMIVENIPVGTRVFAIRSFDAQSNRSGLSNMVKVEVK
jgi:hypothetical protein